MKNEYDAMQSLADSTEQAKFDAKPSANKVKAADGIVRAVRITMTIIAILIIASLFFKVI